MGHKNSATLTVLAAIEKNGGNLSFNELEKSTGLGFTELSAVIGLLMKENLLLVRINHFAKGACLYKSSQEALYACFLDLLFVHFRCERSVAFYASKMCITSKYLTVVVKAVSGKTPSEWIREETVKEIERMLCHTQKSIKEIASELNFSNISFFGKYFKAYKGISPKHYRKAYISNFAAAISRRESNSG